MTCYTIYLIVVEFKHKSRKKTPFVFVLLDKEWRYNPCCQRQDRGPTHCNMEKVARHHDCSI